MSSSTRSRKSKKLLESTPAASIESEADEGCQIPAGSSDGKGSKSSKKTKRSEGEKELMTEKTPAPKRAKKKEVDSECYFVGEPIPALEARKRWPERYEKKNRATTPSKSNEEEEVVLTARCHYSQAHVDGCIYNLNDCAFVKAGDGEPDYIGRIVEFFETPSHELHFTAQWFYKPEDTAIKAKEGHDRKRVFISELKDPNSLDCIVSKINIVRVSPTMDLEEKKKIIASCDFYYDMSYSIGYSTFAKLPTENERAGSETSSTISSEAAADGATSGVKSDSEESSYCCGSQKSEMTLLDLYSGCGGMSTGLCLGANLAGVNLVTRWAVDLNEFACKSLKHNHPETEVRNESADDFLTLLKEWEKLCKKFSLLGTKKTQRQNMVNGNDEDEEEGEDVTKVPGEFEVEKFVGICFGPTDNVDKPGLKFKVRWKGYGSSEDTWEPIEGLSKCQERIKEFVTRGYRSSILPLPGDVDVICGGPPCQGISGFNRFRNTNAPLEDPKNRQMVVYMDIVDYLKPKYVLMENVVDILKFAGGFLGRYAVSRLVSMSYQARLGIMAAGCFGLPQFRLRVFLWGACPSEKLPQYPLPTHDVVVRGNVPVEFERSVVAFDEDQPRELEKALLLGDAISDLPPVTNHEGRDEMQYGKDPTTEFQQYIRLQRHELGDSFTRGPKSSEKTMLFDHRPLQLNEDDFQRVCQIPKRKGANFRHLPGVRVREDNAVEWDESVERVYLPSGKPLVPDYAMSFVRGKSSKPFGRLWYDETVPTVVTRAEPHNQTILHPNQDRVLSIRENARLQGFPDYYKLFGPVKERYIQVGNAVAVPVARALGYALGCASRRMGGDEPLMELPRKFPQCLQKVSSPTAQIEAEDVVV
ncbi:DNA (cytosine-5)-methyltransferase CMT3-like [Magnolia sinica]|uniref:DNA (cytosine-5)-methyltransferase CMT3-like n=1 Tax=Magnolia sinica TaxID=86752 RepID=UPI0026580FBC|nr:DNA (cytosine-5)-methyltransferase CMT3-like [Magnolia sinica]